MISQIRKRDGEFVNYDSSKIVDAIQKAHKEVTGESLEVIDKVINNVEKELIREEDIVTVELIQDKVEEALLEQGIYDTAKAYILYREKQRQNRKRDIFKKRKEMKPYEYPEMLEYADAIRHSYWVHTEFNFTSDIQDFHTKLKPHEKTAVQNSMLAISQVEVDIKKFWGNLHDKFPKYEFSAVGGVFAESELRHSEAYSALLEHLGLNEQFNRIDEIPALSNRVDYLAKSVAWAKTGEDKDYVLSLILFSLFIEHVSLFSQFLIMMSFNKYQNTLSGLSNVIEATSKEEQIHGLFGIDIVNVIREEKPEWFDENMEKAIYDACLESFEAEKKVVDWIFEDGELDFLPKEVVLEFIKNRMNNSLLSVGYDKLFDTDAELVRESTWFEDEVISTKLTDFFNKRSVNYTKYSQAIKANTLFSPTSEFVQEGADNSKAMVNATLRLRMLEL